jgi:hypothetical protein
MRIQQSRIEICFYYRSLVEEWINDPSAEPISRYERSSIIIAIETIHNSTAQAVNCTEYQIDHNVARNMNN